MIEKEEYVVEVPKKEIVKIKCDGCEATEEFNPRRGIWEDDGEDFETTEVKAKLIVNGYYKNYDFDVCPSCFLTKIVPLFDGKGEESRIEEIKNEIKRMIEHNNKEREVASKASEKARNMREQAVYLERIATCSGRNSALNDLLNVIRSLG